MIIQTWWFSSVLLIIHSLPSAGWVRSIVISKLLKYSWFWPIEIIWLWQKVISSKLTLNKHATDWIRTAIICSSYATVVLPPTDCGNNDTFLSWKRSSKNYAFILLRFIVAKIVTKTVEWQSFEWSTLFTRELLPNFDENYTFHILIRLGYA